MNPPDIAALNAPAIRSQLSAEHDRQLAELIVCDAVTSTNDILWQHQQQGLSQAALCVAHAQTAGRGRRGSDWQSPASGNIYMSVLWPCQDGFNHEGLSIAIGICVIHALQEFGISGLQLKWPNDILFERQKLAGILVESRFGDGHFMVIGLGVNYVLPEAIRAQIPQPVTSLQQLTATLPDRNHLIGRLSDHILTTLDVFMHKGLADFLPQWPQFDALHNSPIHILTEQGSITALACGINEQGELRYMHNQQLGSLSNSHVSIRFAS